MFRVLRSEVSHKIKTLTESIRHKVQARENFFPTSDPLLRNECWETARHSFLGCCDEEEGEEEGTGSDPPRLAEASIADRELSLRRLQLLRSSPLPQETKPRTPRARSKLGFFNHVRVGAEEREWDSRVLEIPTRSERRRLALLCWGCCGGGTIERDLEGRRGESNGVQEGRGSRSETLP